MSLIKVFTSTFFCCLITWNLTATGSFPKRKNQQLVSVHYSQKNNNNCLCTYIIVYIELYKLQIMSLVNKLLLDLCFDKSPIDYNFYIIAKYQDGEITITISFIKYLRFNFFFFF